MVLRVLKAGGATVAGIVLTLVAVVVVEVVDVSPLLLPDMLAFVVLFAGLPASLYAGVKMYRETGEPA
ncbi:hypothetical protein [Halosimplex carlsbadense]|uniref:hypothetical protein n=1 Tax=Halosimplex carlsbadense TaxID=171164 RepID=UPI0006781099|nr:hypothetical protein [Halosimplex carlsbadense]